jgi:hypothetical protein
VQPTDHFQLDRTRPYAMPFVAPFVFSKAQIR